MDQCFDVLIQQKYIIAGTTQNMTRAATPIPSIKAISSVEDDSESFVGPLPTPVYPHEVELKFTIAFERPGETIGHVGVSEVTDEIKVFKEFIVEVDGAAMNVAVVAL